MAVESTRAAVKRTLLMINIAMLGFGNCGGPLIMRLYFIHGGKRIWFSSWLETGGWPLILIPLLFSYKRTVPLSEQILMSPRVFLSAAVLGLLTGLDDYLYAYGVARLPLSTSALIIATQLGFTAFFAFVLVKQKFTAYSINAVVLLSVGAAVLGMHTSSDRPKGESNREYFLGFFTTVAAAALYGLVLPLVELTYKKSKRALSYTVVLQVQLVMSFFATFFCTIGMIVNKDFQAVSREAKEFELGEFKYYMVITFSAIAWQSFFLGAIGVIFCASSLLSGIIIAVLLPVTEILAVILYREKFQPEKALSLFLSIWGFIYYFYGEIRSHNHLPQHSPPAAAAT